MSNFQGPDAPSSDDILNCIRCGACLPTCPTYQLTGNERSSPRGRIALMRAVDEEQLTLDSPIFQAEMDYCVGCLACVTACPAGVNYEHLIEQSKAQVARHRWKSWPLWKKAVVSGLLKMFEDLRILRLLSKGIFVYQRLGIQRMLKWSGLLKKVAPVMAELDSTLPKLSGRLSSQAIPEVTAGKPDGHRLGVLNGCVMDFMFDEENLATVEVLNRCGHTVLSPKQQVCCGALHAHAGQMDTARELAKTNIAAYEHCEVEYLVSNSAGCGNALKHYGEWLHDDPQWAERAEKFSQRIKDLSEWLQSDQGWKPLSAGCQGCSKRKVTYHDACHLAHGQGVRQPPRKLLKGNPEHEYIELHDADRCCGSAGTYNILQFETASKLLDAKVEAIKESGAETVVVANPGCLLQIRYGLKRAGLETQAVHPAIVWRDQLRQAQQKEMEG
jgi:glycolate oxidase iron-sulfur subunit